MGKAIAGVRQEGLVGTEGACSGSRGQLPLEASLLWLNRMQAKAAAGPIFLKKSKPENLERSH